MAGNPINRGRDRKQLHEDIQDAIRKYLPDYDRQYDPIIEMALVGANPRTPADLRAATNREVAKYLYHPLKAVDLSNGKNLPKSIQVLDFSQIGPNNGSRLLTAQHYLEQSEILDNRFNKAGDQEDDDENNEQS